MAQEKPIQEHKSQLAVCKREIIRTKMEFKEQIVKGVNKPLRFCEIYEKQGVCERTGRSSGSPRFKGVSHAMNVLLVQSLFIVLQHQSVLLGL